MFNEIELNCFAFENWWHWAVWSHGQRNFCTRLLNDTRNMPQLNSKRRKMSSVAGRGVMFQHSSYVFSFLRQLFTVPCLNCTFAPSKVPSQLLGTEWLNVRCQYNLYSSKSLKSSGACYHYLFVLSSWATAECCLAHGCVQDTEDVQLTDLQLTLLILFIFIL